MKFVDCILNEIKLDKTIASYNQREVSLVDIFNSDKLYVVTIEDFSEVNIYDEKYQNLFKDKVIITNDAYLNSALRTNYICTQICVYDIGFTILELEKKEDNQLYLVKADNIDYYIVENINNPMNVFYGLEKYSKIVIKLDSICKIKNIPNYASNCILPPKVDFDHFKELTDFVRRENLSDENVKDYIESKFSEYVLPVMIKTVKENNINPKVTEIEIKEDYFKLLFDFIKAFRDDINNDINLKQRKQI